MKIILFSHPVFLKSQSMPRFANMIQQGMLARDHSVDVWSPVPFFFRLPLGQRLKKWLGYLDQFIVFPLQVRMRLKKISGDTLFVFSDQALGPWVPLVSKRPHAIHVHDFMALRSSLGEFVQNPTGWAGRQYQAIIRRGFGHGQAFISVSEKTRTDLHRFLPGNPRMSAMLYNGLNYPFRRMSQAEYLPFLTVAGLNVPASGFLLHVGGNQWYKNRTGVIEIYEAYIQKKSNPLPLWMIGPAPTNAMKAIVQRIGAKGDVRFLSGLADDQVCFAYSAARLMIFPSLAEGFGWPIAEAMACGCPVLTTGEAPMTEVGGEAAYYIPRRPNTEPADWATHAGEQVVNILALPSAEQQDRQEQGFRQAAKFDTQRTMNAYEKIYQQIVEMDGVTN
jgi:glycosyltransferase involved in cell wall biosynthesis